MESIMTVVGGPIGPYPCAVPVVVLVAFSRGHPGISPRVVSGSFVSKFTVKTITKTTFHIWDETYYLVFTS
jgi:hypothetical protein